MPRNELLSLALLAFFISFANAASYFVSTTGSDLGDGRTLATAFRTVQKGVNALSAGDALYIGQGTYAENVVRSGLAGTAQNPILITSLPGQKAFINANFYDSALRLDGAYFSIENLVLANGGTHTGSGSISTIKIDYGNNVIIRNVEVYGTVAPCQGEAGQIFFETSNNILVENSIVHDSAYTNGEINCGGIAFDATNYVNGSRNITVRNNTIYNMPIGTGIWDKHPAEGTFEVDHNTVYNVDTGVLIRNRNYYLHHNRIYNVTEYGILLWSENTGYLHLDNPRIEYNTVANCGKSGLRYTMGRNTTMKKNIFSECTSKNAATAYERTLTVCLDGWRCNDPFYQPDFANISSIHSSDNCLYYSPSSLPFLLYALGATTGQYYQYSLAQAQSIYGLEQNSVFTDPAFVSVNPRTTDFLRPAASGACNNMGYFANQGPIPTVSPSVLPSPSPSIAPSPSVIPSPSPSILPSPSPSLMPSPSTCAPTISVDSTYAGNSPSVIDDGIINANGGTATTWGTAESTTLPHWVEKAYCNPVTINNATIWWAFNSNQNAYMTSQTIQVQYFDGTTWQTAASMPFPGANQPISTVQFSPIAAQRWRLYQPAGEGATTYASVMWLTEIEFNVIAQASPSPSTSIIPSTSPSVSPSPSTPPCIENWSCTNWSACTNSSQTRACLDLNSCGTTQSKPSESQSCVMPSPSVSINPSVSVNPSASIAPCIESWSCTGFNACSNGIQSQLCTDANSCGTIANRPVLSQSCTVPSNSGPSSSSSNTATSSNVGPQGTPKPTPKVSPTPTLTPKEFSQTVIDVERQLPDISFDQTAQKDIADMLSQAKELERQGNRERALVLLNQAKKKLNDTVAKSKERKAGPDWILGSLFAIIILAIGIYYYKKNSVK